MTPARIPYQNDLIDDVVRREGFGADEVPDLLHINYKLTDEIGHTDSMNSVEMSDAVRATMWHVHAHDERYPDGRTEPRVPKRKTSARVIASLAARIEVTRTEAEATVDILRTQLVELERLRDAETWFNGFRVRRTAEAFGRGWSALRADLLRRHAAVVGTGERGCPERR